MKSAACNWNRGTAAASTRVTGPSVRPSYKAGDIVAPGRQTETFLFQRSSLVGDVIDDPTEGIDRIHRVPAVRRKHTHAVVERRPGRTHDRFYSVEIRLGDAERRGLRGPTGPGTHTRWNAADRTLKTASAVRSFTRVANGSLRTSLRASRFAKPWMMPVSSRRRALRTISGSSDAAWFIRSTRSSNVTNTRRRAGVSAGRRKSATEAPK